MTIADTSALAYDELRAGKQLSKMQARIVTHFSLHPKPLTRAELAAVTGIALSSVCGRVNELLEDGVLTEGPIRKCGMTGNSAHDISLAPIHLRLAL